ncbi:hypothetical protein [Staphylococcus pasteuri]|uniref:hypothetical protein n=1 Tax=Staphylococcus pasteuri TaxID=45972 RepID=UPI000D376DBE|nr:hypothetical protein [Staphylococcus pasteuri]PTU83387.1 hypothetical protein BUZ66_02745 [Staphylococcus pasteuri]RIO37678.1 hypothetical protein BUZ65_01955 [Staphylococcus pasteuri]
MDKEPRQNEMEYINVVSLTTMGILAVVRGMFWIISSEETSHDSPLYESMHELLNLSFWGIPFFVGGVCMVIASIALPYRRVNNLYSVFLIIGGVMCSVFFFIIALAGMDQALNWLTPVTFLIMSMGSGGYAYVGVLFYRK